MGSELAGVRLQDLTEGSPAGAFLTRLLTGFGAELVNENADVIVGGASEDPSVITCSITPWGEGVPGRAHDLNVLARSGMLDLSGELDGPPVQPAGLIAEVGGGALMAAIGILLALRERDRTGKGRHLDVSMLAGTHAWMTDLTDQPTPERGTLDRRGGMVSYMPFPCKDGWVTLAALEPEAWEAFCRGLEREDLLDHHADRSDGWAQGQLEHLFLRRTREEWRAFGEQHDCCLEPVLTVGEALAREDGAVLRGERGPLAGF